MEQKSYFRLLLDSFKLLFRNKKLLIPVIVMFVLNGFLFFTRPYRNYIGFSLGQDVNFSIGSIIFIIVASIVMSLFSLIMYGWIFALIKPIVEGVEYNLKSEFNEGLKLALTLFLLGLLGLGLYLVLILVFILFFVLIGLLGSGGIIISILVGLIVVLSVLALILFLGSYSIPLIGVLIMERGGVIFSIKKAWVVYKKNLGNSFALFGITILLNFIVYIPTVIVMVVFMSTTFLTGQSNIDPTLYYFVTNLASLPYLVVFLAILIYYSLNYHNRVILSSSKKITVKNLLKK
tara:strand:- start:14506 stop:15378 length:873 start_codon:yes stop_codon:yes gene_type:complete